MLCCAVLCCAAPQVYAFLADHYSNTLAKVLFWTGASLMMLFSGVCVDTEAVEMCVCVDREV